MQSTTIKPKLISNKLKMIVILLINIIFTSKIMANELCIQIYETNLVSGFSKLSYPAKQFWLEIGRQFEEYINGDFARPANKEVIKRESERNHPFLEFLKSMEFQISKEGLQSPAFHRVLEHIQAKVNRLNNIFKSQSLDIELKPKIHLNLVNNVEMTQKIVLDIFQPHHWDKYSISPEPSLLKEKAFANQVGRGFFPIGGVANASRVPRSIMLLKEYEHTPNIIDFLHDLAHLDSFFRNPEFAISYVKVFRERYNKWERIKDPDEKVKYENDTFRMGSQKWIKVFMFSESSWIVKPAYFEILKEFPIISTLLKYEGDMSVKEISVLVNKVNKSELFKELNLLKLKWWKLFDPLGGAINDMISVASFDSKSQMPLIGILERLDHITTNINYLNSDFRTIGLIIGLLKYSPELSVKKWEYFARSSTDSPSALQEILKKMFPEKVLDSHQWEVLGKFLYPNFGKL